MALTCEFFMIDEIFVLYENSGKYFNSYNNAYFNSKNAGCDRQVYYVFTPTMQKFKRVYELENACREYLRNCYDCDYLDIITKVRTKQLRLEI